MSAFDPRTELAAETFAAALEAAPRYRPRPEPARGWLYGIAWMKLRDAQRRTADRQLGGSNPVSCLPGDRSSRGCRSGSPSRRVSDG